MPHTLNAMMFFYRKDLFEAAGKAPPKTIAEYRDLAKSFNSPMRAGTISCLKPVDAAINEAHWYINALGDGWFDKDWRPVFNDAKGVQAIEMMKEITRYAQQGFSAAANDECTIAYQQDTGTMGLQWATRAKAMDDPAKSRVVGKIDWVAPPEGRARIAGDGYAHLGLQQAGPGHAVPHHRHVVEPGEHARRGVADHSAAQVADRRSGAGQGEPLLSGGAGVVRNRPAGPALPEFYAVGEFITRRILQAVTGEMPVKAGARRGGDGDHGLPQGPRLLQVTCVAAAVAAPFPDPKVVGGCSLCRVALVLAGVMLYPLGYAIWLSLFNYDLGSGTFDFIGLGNYAALLADARFWDYAEPHGADRAGRRRAGVLPRPAGGIRAVSPQRSACAR